MQTGYAYSNETAAGIKGTLALLRWYRAFLRSDYNEANDPIRGFGYRLDKAEARRDLTRLVQVAINRRASDWSCDLYDDGVKASIYRLAQAVNTPRLRVYEQGFTDVPKRIRIRVSHRFVRADL